MKSVSIERSPEFKRAHLRFHLKQPKGLRILKAEQVSDPY